jgi:prophage DNA circulation protein
MKITQIPNTKWRDELMPASYGGAFFHVEQGSKENGRRIVLHEFPKKEIPYPEDLGRRARLYSVRGYCIAYPIDTPEPLYTRDYRDARNLLIAALEREGPALLQLPTIPAVLVVNMQYRWSEEEKLGGYCVFDMSFVEYGVPETPQIAPSDVLNAQAIALRDQVVAAMANATETLRVQALAAGVVLPPSTPPTPTPPGPG